MNVKHFEKALSVIIFANTLPHHASKLLRIESWTGPLLTDVDSNTPGDKRQRIIIGVLLLRLLILLVVLHILQNLLSLEETTVLWAADILEFITLFSVGIQLQLNAL